MVRIIIGVLLIVLYIISGGVHLLNILSGDPNPMGVERSAYITTTQQSLLFGFFLFVLPGILFIFFGYRDRKRKENKAQDQGPSPHSINDSTRERIYKCPHCAYEYKLSDYKDDLENIYCSNCKNELPKISQQFP